MDTTPPRENGIMSPKRLSGENKPTTTRKKSGFSNFMSSVLGSPRTIKISAPQDPMHMIHVGYDNQTGQFTVSSSLPNLELKLTVGRVCPKTGSRCCPPPACPKTSKIRIQR
jgi:hypothetical protein